MIKLYKEYVESKRLANLQIKLKIFRELEQISYLSKRFALEEALNLSKERIKYNDVLWEEENGSAEDKVENQLNNLFSKVGLSK